MILFWLLLGFLIMFLGALLFWGLIELFVDLVLWLGPLSFIILKLKGVL